MKMINNRGKTVGKDEIGNWWRQGEADFKAAENCIGSGDYFLAIFSIQQAIEKSLKALVLEKKGELIKTHSLMKLSRIVYLPKNISEKIEEIEPVYQESRYPDLNPQIPSERFKEKDALEFLDKAKEIITWIKKELKL
jgi:HEPN domain-containing protein